jgi:hypothetical protein
LLLVLVLSIDNFHIVFLMEVVGEQLAWEQVDTSVRDWLMISDDSTGAME